jgi:2-dehydro-3-deoxyphosphogluconate aldolase/(4S)-4-hydroxy-2-oxoglutarate aldolase
MTKEEVRACIQQTGIIPALRVSTAEDALFAAEILVRGGIPVIEIPMTVAGAFDVVKKLASCDAKITVGAGTVLDAETARRCIDSGAMFLTSTGLLPDVVDVAVKHNVLVLPGALTPTEVILAWRAGADFVKVFPCTQLGGDVYIRSLHAALPQIPLIAAGGVRQNTAAHFIHAGAVAIGVGKELLPHDAVEHRKADWILELAHRFVSIVKNARSQPGERKDSVVTFR